MKLCKGNMIGNIFNLLFFEEFSYHWLY